MKNEVERKYRKPLNKNSWMAKIQRFVWGGKTPEFTGYCPFFWFTWLCLLLAPFKLLVLVLLLPLIGLGMLWDKVPDHPARLSYDTLLEIYDFIQEFGQDFFLEHATDKIAKWIAATPDWFNCVLAAVAKRDRKAAATEKRASRDRAWLKSLANKLHYIVKPVLWIAATIALYFLTKILIWIIPLIYWPKVGEVFLFIAAVVLVLAIAVGMIFVIELLWKIYRKKCPKCPDRIGFWRTLGGKLWIPLDFLWETVAVIYTRECPLIEWADESGPIRRNE